MCNFIWRLFWWTFPANADVFRTSSGRLKKVTTSYDQTKRLYDTFRCRHVFTYITLQTSRHLAEDVWFTTSRRGRIYVLLKTFDLQRLEDVWFMMSWRRLIYDVLKTSDLRRLKELRFSTFWRGLIYDVLKTSNLRHLDDLSETTSVEKATSAQRQKTLFFLILHSLKYSENFKCLARLVLRYQIL